MSVSKYSCQATRIQSWFWCFIYYYTIVSNNLSLIIGHQTCSKKVSLYWCSDLTNNLLHLFSCLELSFLLQIFDNVWNCFRCRRNSLDSQMNGHDHKDRLWFYIELIYMIWMLQLFGIVTWIFFRFKWVLLLNVCLLPF